MFDAYGDFNEPIIAHLNTLLDAPPGDCGSYTEISSVFTANLYQSSPQEPDWNTQRPFLDTLVCDAYGIKSTKQFINILSDNIRKRGAMDTLISDGGKYEISQ